MANRLHLREGSVEPWLVVGLGGTGSRIVEHLAHRLLQEPYWEGQLDALVQFLCIDTNQGDQNALAARVLHKAAIAEFHKPELMKRHLTNPSQQVAHFINPDYEPREGGGAGAGQVRMESRFSFYHQSEHIEKVLRDLVGRFDRPSFIRGRGAEGQPRHYVNVLMVFSAAGGTGSGAFLPFAYLVNDVITRQLSGLRSRTFPVVLLSTLFQHTLSPGGLTKAHANCYAALKEIEHLQMLRYGKGGSGSGQEQFVYRRAPQDEIPQVSDGPFDWVHLIDRVLPVRGSTMRDMEPSIADAIFATYFTPVFNELRGPYDNTDSITKVAPSPSPLGLAGLGKTFANHYGTMGAAFLVLPDVAVAMYCSLRAAAHLLTQQLTLAADAPELAARLAAARIDTKSKRFLSADESVKTEMLNKSYRATVEALAAHEEEEARREGYPPTSRWALLVDRVTKGRLREVRPRVAAVVQGEAGEPAGPAPSPASSSPGGAAGPDPRRETTLVQRVRDELRRERERAFSATVAAQAISFQEENVEAAEEIVSRLERAYAAEKVRMRLAEDQLRLGARQGDVFRRIAHDEQLFASGQRYLMIVVRSTIDQWIAEVESKVSELSAEEPVLDNTAYVTEKTKAYAALRDAATRTWMEVIRRENSDFEEKKQEFRQRTSRLAAIAVVGLHAALELAQLKELRTFLNERLDLYRRVSDGIAAQIEELEADAAGIRDSWQPPRAVRKRLIPPGFVNRTEALAAGDGSKPSDRLWNEYFELVIKDVLAQQLEFASVADAVGRQFEPVVDGRTGRTRDKLEQEVLHDIVEAVLSAAESVVKPYIEGGTEKDPEGLTLLEALTVEAELTQGLRLPRKDATATEHDEELRKLAAHFESRLNRVDSVLHGLAELKPGEGTSQSLKSTFLLVDAAEGGRSGYNERLAEIWSQKVAGIPILRWRDTKVLGMVRGTAAYPIFAFPVVQNALEPAYLDAQAGRLQTAVSDLHIEWRWERMLPDLNPERTYHAAEWCLQALARGYMFGLVRKATDGKAFEWPLPAGGHAIRIGDAEGRLTDFVYHLGLVWANHKDTKDGRARLLVESIEKMRQACTDVIAAKNSGLAAVTAVVNRIESRPPGQRTSQDNRELVVLQRLRDVLTRVENEPWNPFEDAATHKGASGLGGQLLG